MKKKVVIFVVFILIILMIIFIIKFNKVNKIVNLIEENSKKLNYYYINEDVLDNNFSIFVKRNGNVVVSNFLLNPNSYFYYNFDKNIVYKINNENKVYLIRDLDKFDEQVLQFPFYKFLTFDYSLKNKLKLVFEWKISNYDNDRYEITTKNNYKIIFDKKSGIALSAININPDERVDQVIKEFEFDSVTDEDIELPDLSEYQEISNMN